MKSDKNNKTVRKGGYMKKEYRNVIRTKKMIRKAFTELLEEKKDIEHISVNELAERADLSKSTFYYHYEDIYAVAEEFESELIDKLSEVLEEIEKEQATEYDIYIKIVIDFLKEHEDMYCKVISSSSPKLFIDKLKSILSKKVFEQSKTLPFSKDENIRYVQIRFLTNACVDTMVDYFKGFLNASLEQVGEILLGIIDKLK